MRYILRRQSNREYHKMKNYFHDTPGRLRVRITAVRGNPPLGNQIEELLINTWGITGVSVRLTTGSVVIKYDPQILDANRILNFLAEHGYIEMTNLSVLHPSLQTAVYRATEVIVMEALSLAVSKVFHGRYPSILTNFL